MSACKAHEGHSHTHGAGCGHKRIGHEQHDDFLHDGHMHHVHGDHVDEHELSASAANPDACAAHACGAHPGDHKHGAGCGHEAVPHAGHTDYLVDGHLHHAHGSHCDHHGQVSVTA